MDFFLGVFLLGGFWKGVAVEVNPGNFQEFSGW